MGGKTKPARKSLEEASTGTTLLPTPGLGELSEEELNTRLGELLDSIRCRPVLERLQTKAGYSEHVAQRACLEVHQAKREVSFDSALKWIRRHDIAKIDKPLQPLELLKYLSDIVVSLVGCLPKPDSAQLQRQLAAADMRGNPSPLASSPACQRASVAGEGDLLGKLAAAEAAKGDVEAMLQELGAMEDPPAPAPSLATTASSAGSTTLDAAGGGSATGELALVAGGPGGVGGSGGAGFTGRVAQQMLGLQQQMSKAMQSLASLGRSSNGSSSTAEAAAEAAIAEVAAAGAAGAAAHEAAHAGGHSTAQGNTAHFSGGGASGATSASSSAILLPPSGPPVPPPLSAEAQALIQRELCKLQLNDGQLASLRAMLGPGTAYESLPAIDLKLLGTQTAATVRPASADASAAAPAAAEAPAGSVPVAEAPAEPMTPEAELASLRQHREWADRRISQLIRRVAEAERPMREEAAKLLREVQALRVEKEGMQERLQELERSIARVKESTYVEAAQKRESERAAAIVAAELKAASLREAEALSESRSLAKQLAQERKRREAAEARSKKCASNAAGAASAAATAVAHDEVEALKSELAKQQQLAEERRRALAAAEAEVAYAGARAGLAATADKGRCEMLLAEKASLEAALEESHRSKQRAQALWEDEKRALLRKLALAQERAAQVDAKAQGLQQQLAAAQEEAASATKRAAEAESRVAAAVAAAESAHQQLTALAQHQRQQNQNQQHQTQQQQLLFGSSAALSTSDLHLSAPGPATAASRSNDSDSAGAGLFSGAGMGMWGGGGLFGSVSLHPPASSSPAPSIPHPPHSLSMGSSSPLSHSGGATPLHSMACSISNSPVGPPGSLAMPSGPFLHSFLSGGGGGGGGGLFAPLPQRPSSAFPSADSSLFGSVSLAPDSTSIWGMGGASVTSDSMLG